nr:MAG TPA: hypothetical protein [Caudoviricetes sp.]
MDSGNRVSNWDALVQTRASMLTYGTEANLIGVLLCAFHRLAKCNPPYTKTNYNRQQCQ